MTKGNHLLLSSKYHSVKSLNVYIFIVLGSTLLVRWASCQVGDLLAPHKNSLAPGKRTGVLLHPVYIYLIPIGGNFFVCVFVAEDTTGTKQRRMLL